MTKLIESIEIYPSMPWIVKYVDLRRNERNNSIFKKFVAISDRIDDIIASVRSRSSLNY